MLSVFLACDNPYEIARLMTEHLGWHLEFATPADSEDRLTCVKPGSLAGAQVRLGTADERFLPPRAASIEGRG